MKILQALPALYSGGVERGTVEFAAELVKRGHESFVVSNGGPMAEQVRGQGSTHIHMPIHRKTPASFGQILPMRKLLQELKPDIVHVRSRMPAWIINLALKTLPADQQPGIVSTFHGMYSVNPYSAIMAKADHVIAVSNCVRDYVLKNFILPEDKLTVIQRGVDIDAFRHRVINDQWLDILLSRFPQLAGKKIIMMPGRISRWKGQLDYLEVMARIVCQRPDCHGIIVGGAEPGKERFLQELERERSRLGLTDTVTFLGQRNDMTNLYLFADVVCHMSTKPEPFGRTVTEALASGAPVVAYNRGGAAETLQACFKDGLVAPDDSGAFASTVLALLDKPRPVIELPDRFLLKAQTEATLAIYERVLARKGARPA
ncbi:glycosyltransferase family 4 protein [Marinobacter halophilus]|uniref:Glycosyl transferase n=1 Tax=Marinobacter halophilus TaxID=1323740 RepID=A0A2T1KHQ2_9GAMM|nr:glycosyltransferase family 4 protein [Marinobacter halophilus]PSF09112.1 glycosyl transferase [Marinobacter halophilus]GGC83289.1 glycosyl transferase [Marinobacter halophilus]